MVIKMHEAEGCTQWLSTCNSGSGPQVQSTWLLLLSRIQISAGVWDSFSAKLWHMQDNLYWLGLLTHLQRDEVPGKTVDILRDLVTMYEAATVDDIYEALQHFNLDDNNVFTCIGVSGKEPPQLAPFEIQNAGNLQSKSGSNGSNSWGNSGNGQQKPSLNPRESANAMMSALKAAAQSGQLASYMQGNSDGKNNG